LEYGYYGLDADRENLWPRTRKKKLSASAWGSRSRNARPLEAQTGEKAHAKRFLLEIHAHEFRIRARGACRDAGGNFRVFRTHNFAKEIHHGRYVSDALLLAALVALPLTAAAQGKVAVVNLDEALAESQAGKAALAQLKTKFEAREKSLAQQGEELKKLQADLQKKSVACPRTPCAARGADFEGKA
jgi:hypothetical protein